MKKALMITVVVFLAAVGGILPFMNGMMIWDGSVFVPIAVSVFDEHRRPVVGASVSLILPRDTDHYKGISEDEYRGLLLSDKRIFETDELGTGSLGGRFPAGGRYGTFKKRGRYTIVGDVLIVHPDFQEFRVSLRNLLQASDFSIDESELELAAFLEPAKAEQDVGLKGLQP
jgi:predicted acylesterase/phospholipase RssA